MREVAHFLAFCYYYATAAALLSRAQIGFGADPERLFLLYSKRIKSQYFF